jgi:hypothetical protein
LFADIDLTQRAKTLRTVTLSVIVIAVSILTAIAIAQPELIVRTVTPIIIITVLCLFVLELNRQGKTLPARVILVSGLILIVTVTALTAGGIRSPGVTMYCVFALMAGVLMGMRAGTIAAIACGWLALGLVLLELSGNLPASRVEYSALT